MNNSKYIKLTALIAALTILSSGALMAQVKNSRKVAKAQVIEVTATVVDESGQCVSGATVISGEGAITRHTDASGRFSIKSTSDDVILIEAAGFKDYVLNLRVGRAPQMIKLEKEVFLAGEKDFIDRTDGRLSTRHENIAAISIVDPDPIRKFPDLNISSALQGQAGGLIVRGNNGGLGNNGASFYVRGLHATGTAAIVVIDGIERSIDDICAEEIGSIEILKDAPAKVLYGPRAANGVILISTRRGEANKKIIRTTMEYGVSPSTRVPEFLGAYEYATLYNEARVNDGMTPYYTSAQLDGYRNTSGENDLLYPDVDWYGRFTGNTQTYRKAVGEFIGGNESMKYALVTSYTGGSGLESVGERSDLNRLNLRGNLDMRINDVITATADVAARLELKTWGTLSQNTLFSRLSTMRPNEYPLVISAENLGLSANSNGIPYFGGSTVWKQNLLDDMQYGGNSAERYVISQTNLGLEFDLGRFVKGLKADGYITFDNYSYVSQSLTKYHATYAVTPYTDDSGAESLRVALVRKLNENDNIVVNSDKTKRTIGARGSISYEHSSGLNTFAATGAYRYYFDKSYGSNQDCITTTATARFNYSYNSRFFAEAILGLMGSNQLGVSNRYIFTPTLALGYVISNEPYTKVKASAGRIGYDPNSNYLLYNTTWTYPGDYALGATGDVVAYRTALSTCGNADLGWITSTEANIGVETYLFNKQLSIDANAFTELRDGGFSGLSSAYSSVIGDFLKNVNYTQVRNSGIDLAVRWADSSQGGDLRYSAGLNLTIAQNKVVRANEIDGIESYRKTVGRPTSSIIALESEGLFGRDVELLGHATQTYGVYQNGDIAYKDKNNDEVIDSRDETFLGQTFPIAAFGLNFDLNYKGFGIYMLGTSELGASKMLNNSYYWNNDIASYSVLARERYHETANPNGSLPRLTTTSGGNSYQNSSFWMKDASFFRLKNLELSYTLSNINPDGWFKQCKFFVQGTNLFVISAIKDLDPEMIDAGVTNYPVYRTFAGGLTISF